MKPTSEAIFLFLIVLRFFLGALAFVLQRRRAPSSPGMHNVSFRKVEHSQNENSCLPSSHNGRSLQASTTVATRSLPAALSEINEIHFKRAETEHYKRI